MQEDHVSFIVVVVVFFSFFNDNFSFSPHNYFSLMYIDLHLNTFFISPHAPFFFNYRAVIMACLWFVYIILSALQAEGVIVV